MYSKVAEWEPIALATTCWDGSRAAAENSGWFGDNFFSGHREPT